jgi:hypothetical protein
MESAMHDAKKSSLHPVTILTMLDKDQQIVACKALLDQCCTDKGLISWDLVQTLCHPMSMSDAWAFMATSGIFTMDKVLHMSCAMLLCLLMNHTFTTKLMVMVVPKQ